MRSTFKKMKNSQNRGHLSNSRFYTAEVDICTFYKMSKYHIFAKGHIWPKWGQVLCVHISHIFLSHKDVFGYTNLTDFGQCHKITSHDQFALLKK